MLTRTTSENTAKPLGRNDGDASPGVIRPMGLRLSLLFFLTPAVLDAVLFYAGIPFLISLKVQPFFAQTILSTIVMASLLLASLVAFRVEGRSLTWGGLKERFRLGSMTGKAWLWTLGLTVAAFTLYYLVTPLGTWLISNGFIPIPASLPAWLDPRVSMGFVERFDQTAGGLQGNWLAFFWMATHFILNVLGEEFWFRGYILPRQELALGKRVWLIHGIFWACWHLFKWWDILGLLPGGILMSYVVWRTKNNSIGIIWHVLTNISAVIFVLLGVLGLSLM